MSRENEKINMNKMLFDEYVQRCNSPLLKCDKTYTILSKPNYPQFFNAWLQQKRMFWSYEEVSLIEDRKDWFNKLQNNERKMLEFLFLFFTQLDVEVSKCYTETYMKIFQPLELKQMLIAFADMEVMHSHAYRYLVVEIFGEDEAEKLSKMFLEYKFIKDKYDFLQKHKINTIEDLFFFIIAFGAFTEGVMLYASFAAFLFFPNVRKCLNGMGQIVSFSMKDETLHVESLAKLFHELLKENSNIDPLLLEPKVHDYAHEVYKLESNFIDLMFRDIEPIDGLNSCQLKEYIKYKIDLRLKQFGFTTIFKQETNPLHWMESVGLVERSMFFEVQHSEYSVFKNQDSIDNINEDDWNDMFNDK